MQNKNAEIKQYEKQKDKNGNIIPPDKIKKEGRKVKTLSPMSYVSPYIMKTRTGASNQATDSVCMSEINRYIREKKNKGMTDYSILHFIIASYVRCVSQKPGINRYIRGQKIYARNNIEINFVIKKEMTLESPDTVIKTFFYPDETADEVYYKCKKVIDDYRLSPGGDFDNAANFFHYIPGLVMKFTMWIINILDYFGLLPRFLTKLSPFHGTMFVTSMGSLGIPPIYHHLYDFGNVPTFISFGKKYRRKVEDVDGSIKEKTFIDVKYVLDERICDGFYYASAMKYMKNIYKNPWILDHKPDVVYRDID